MVVRLGLLRAGCFHWFGWAFMSCLGRVDYFDVAAIRDCAIWGR